MNGSATLESAASGELLSTTTPFRFTVQDAGTAVDELHRPSDARPNFLFFQRDVDFNAPQSPEFAADVASRRERMRSRSSGTTRPPPTSAGYVLERAEVASGPFSRVQDRLIAMRYYSDGGLQGLKRYYYRVAAIDSSGNSQPLLAGQGRDDESGHTGGMAVLDRIGTEHGLSRRSRTSTRAAPMRSSSPPRTSSGLRERRDRDHRR